MTSIITAGEKKEFIRWFLNSYQLRRRECVWILNYIMERPHILDNLHFVKDAQYCNHGLIMSTHCESKAPFRYYKNTNTMTTDAEKAFHDIRLNQDDTDFYITLNFKDRDTNSKWYSVLEDNPFSPPEEPEKLSRDQKIANSFVEYTLYEVELRRINQRIDEALDEKDKQKYMKFADMREALVKPEKLFETVRRGN